MALPSRVRQYTVPFVATRLLSSLDCYQPAPPSAMPDEDLITRVDCQTDLTHGAYPADSACLDAPTLRLAGLRRLPPLGYLTAVVLTAPSGQCESYTPYKVCQGLIWFCLLLTLPEKEKHRAVSPFISAHSSGRTYALHRVQGDQCALWRLLPPPMRRTQRDLRSCLA